MLRESIEFSKINHELLPPKKNEEGGYRHIKKTKELLSVKQVMEKGERKEKITGPNHILVSKKKNIIEELGL